MSVRRNVGHRSRASLRRPQCLSFRDGSNTRSTWRFNARITPIRANMVGPSCSATSISACIAACHSSASCRFVVCRHGLDVENPQRHGDVDRIGTGPGISQIGPRIATLLAAVHERTVLPPGHVTTSAAARSHRTYRDLRCGLASKCASPIMGWSGRAPAPATSDALCGAPKTRSMPGATASVESASGD